MKRNFKLLLLMVLCVVLTACSQPNNNDTNKPETTTTENKTETKETNEPAEKPAEKTEYTLIMLPNDGGQINPQTEAIIEEMNVALEPFNAEVNYQSADDYAVVSEAILSGTAQITTGSGATYVQARMEDPDVIPLFVPAPNGNLDEAGYTSYLATNIANKGEYEGLSEEEALKKLKGKSFSFVSATSTSGRLVPTQTLWETFGPNGTNDVQNRTDIFEKTESEGGIFSEVQFGGSHPANVELLTNNRVDAGAFCCEYADDFKDDLYIISQRQVSGDPTWANKKYMKQEHIDAIVKHFEELTPENAKATKIFAPEGEEAGEGKEYYMDNNNRFIKVDPSYFNFLEEMYKEEGKK